MKKFKVISISMPLNLKISIGETSLDNGICGSQAIILVECYILPPMFPLRQNKKVFSGSGVWTCKLRMLDAQFLT